MSEKTGIQWTESTWTAIRGEKGMWHCTKKSPGCANCYSERMNVRYGGPKYVPGADRFRLDMKALEKPLHWRRPRMVFVCSMTDLFHEDVPDEWIDLIFGVMARASKHTFQVLTKRAERMRRYFAARGRKPLPNVWLGVSTENQKAADERIPHLLEIPAAVRFLSVEPLIDRVYLQDWMSRNGGGLSWVIAGAESGPKARPMDLSWARLIVESCRAFRVPVFVKQLGARPTENNIPYRLKDRKGGDPAEWPEDLRVREFPAIEESSHVVGRA